MIDKTWECSYERVKPDEVSVCPTCKHYVKCNNVGLSGCEKGHYPMRTPDGWIVEDCDDYVSFAAPAPEAYDAKSRYYDAGGIETLEIIKAKLTPEQYRGFLLGNSIKYACRLMHKGQPGRDAEKLALYSKWLEEVSDD